MDESAKQEDLKELKPTTTKQVMTLYINQQILILSLPYVTVQDPTWNGGLKLVGNSSSLNLLSIVGVVEVFEKWSEDVISCTMKILVLHHLHECTIIAD